MECFLVLVVSSLEQFRLVCAVLLKAYLLAYLLTRFNNHQVSLQEKFCSDMPFTGVTTGK